MPRYIDADALIDFLDVGHLRHPSELCFSEVDVANLLLHAPTISPDEVRGVGEWIEAAGGNYLVCPECKYDHALYDRLGYSCEHKYCPNCGKRLRMKGAEDGTTE